MKWAFALLSTYFLAAALGAFDARSIGMRGEAYTLSAIYFVGWIIVERLDRIATALKRPTERDDIGAAIDG